MNPSHFLLAVLTAGAFGTAEAAFGKFRNAAINVASRSQTPLAQSALTLPEAQAVPSLAMVQSNNLSLVKKLPGQPTEPANSNLLPAAGLPLANGIVTPPITPPIAPQIQATEAPADELKDIHFDTPTHLPSFEGVKPKCPADNAASYAAAFAVAFGVLNGDTEKGVEQLRSLLYCSTAETLLQSVQPTSLVMSELSIPASRLYARELSEKHAKIEGLFLQKNVQRRYTECIAEIRKEPLFSSANWPCQKSVCDAEDLKAFKLKMFSFKPCIRTPTFLATVDQVIERSLNGKSSTANAAIKRIFFGSAGITGAVSRGLGTVTGAWNINVAKQKEKVQSDAFAVLGQVIEGLKAAYAQKPAELQAIAEGIEEGAKHINGIYEANRVARGNEGVEALKAAWEASGKLTENLAMPVPVAASAPVAVSVPVAASAPVAVSVPVAASVPVTSAAPDALGTLLTSAAPAVLGTVAPSAPAIVTAPVAAPQIIPEVVNPVTNALNVLAPKTIA
jgi:hypothetical protein